MDKLLKWSLNAGSAAPGTAVEAPDPKLLSQLFGAGGKDEVEQMKDNMTVILHPEAEKEDRLTAFDNLEMLIENLDNANNLKPLGMWQPLIAQLDDKDAEIRKMAAWVIGTAVQNNEPAQGHALESGPLKVVPKLLQLVAKPEEADEVKVKALYALTGELGHNPEGYKAFVEADGWATIASLFEQATLGDLKVRARALSLLRILLTIEPVQADSHGTLRDEQGPLVQTLVGPIHLHVSAPEELRNRTLELIGILQEAGFKFTEDEKKQGRALVEELRTAGEIEKDAYKLF